MVGTVNYTLVSAFAPCDVIPRVGIAAEVGNTREIRLAELHAVAIVRTRGVGNIGYKQEDQSTR